MEYQGWDEILIFNLISRKSGGCMRNTVQTTNYCLYAKKYKKTTQYFLNGKKYSTKIDSPDCTYVYILWKLICAQFVLLSFYANDWHFCLRYLAARNFMLSGTDFCHFDDVENMYRLVHVVLDFRPWDIMTNKHYFLMVQI